MIERWIKDASNDLARSDAKTIAEAQKRAKTCGCIQCRQIARATEEFIYSYWNEKECQKMGVVYEKAHTK